MKCNPFLTRRSVILLTSLALVAPGISRLRTPDRQPEELLDNNPQHFQLHSTGTNYSSTFIDDPRAADKWILKTANGVALGRVALPGTTNRPTDVTN
jgi:hypothetical protein